MNKKFSTLVAAFLAVGSLVSVEAGVVKVTKPTSGHAYLIAEGTLVDISTNTALQLLNSSGSIKSNSSDAAAPTTTDNAKWVFSGDLASSFYLMNVGKNENNYMERFETTARYRDYGFAFSYTDNKIVPSNDVDQALKLTSDAAASFDAVASGTSVYFYAVTEKVSDVALTYLKFNGKWLVAKSTTEVLLVSDSELESYKVANPEAAQWKVSSSSGKYESVGQSNNYLYVNSSNRLGLTSTADDALAFEENAAEELFGATKTSTGVFEQLVVNGDNVYLKSTTLSTGDSKAVLERSLATPSANASASKTIASTTYSLAEEIGNEYYLLTSNSSTASYISQQSDNQAPQVLSTAPDEYAYWKVSGNNKDGYTFTNKKGVVLKVGGVSSFKSDNAYKNGFILKAKVGTADKYLSLSSAGALELGDNLNTIANNTFGLYKLGDVPFTASELIEEYDTYFNLLLQASASDDTELQGNPFEGYDLVPMNSDLEPATNGEQSYLLKRREGKDEFYIVLDMDKTWSNAGINNHVDNGGYKFDILSAENMAKYINGTAAEALRKRNLAYTFSVAHAKEMKDIKSIAVYDKNNVPHYLVTFNANEKTYLTVNGSLKNGVYAALEKKTMVHGSDSKNNPLLDRYVSISFVNNVAIKYNTEDNRQALLDGKVLGMNRTGSQAYPMDNSKFLSAKPEGQWFVTMTNLEGKTADELKKGVELDRDENKDVAFTFVNRENPNVSYRVARMFYLGDNKYAVEYDDRNSFSYNNYYTGRDTLLLTPVDIEKNARQMDGYKDYADADLQDVEYRLAVASTSDVDYYVTENHAGRHLLGISKDQEDAATWRLVRMDRARQLDKDGYAKYITDSVYVINHPHFYSNGKYYAYNDTLAMVSYALQNTANGEYMTYEDPQQQDILSMMCQPNTENYVKHSDEVIGNEGVLTNIYRFVLKEKADGKINILGVYGSETSGRGHYTLNLNAKLYGATTQSNGAVEVEGAYAQVNSNDLFDLQRIDAPEYRLKNQGDTIRIFRDENEFDTMYENGSFLNLGNNVTVKDMAPALYIDTAYVNRGHNNCYQYLLVVDPTYKPAVPCDIPGHPALHPDTTYGRFLINLIDSAVYTNKYGEIHNNKFINDKEADETYVKLGFVWGYRTGDKLYLTEGNNFGKVKDTIDLSTRDFNIAKFAFRYVNAAANDKNGAFKIQTRYVDYNSAIQVKDQKDRRENNNGYLKTINGVVVVTEGIARGEEFNLATEHSAPTASEAISTSEVSVVAGKGAVTIMNAAGKNVAICNILGKSIANVTLTSNNETINVPAGTVIISVEGEDVVKAIVK